MGKFAELASIPASGEEKPKLPPPAVFPIGELEPQPSHDDPNELLRFRYLCRGGGGLCGRDLQAAT